MIAKKQLLASLDTDFYNKVITPLRLGVELAKVEPEDIFAHILEVWEQANSGRVKQHLPSAATTVGVAYSGLPSDMDVKALIKDFQFHIDAANKVLASLSDGNENDEPTTRWPAPPTGKSTGKPGVHFPPSSWRDRQNRRRDGKFHGRQRHHRFAVSPLAKGGNWSQQHGRRGEKHFGMHAVSFHFVSKAFVPECVRCPPGFWHDSANCPTADIECDECVLEQADGADGLVSDFQTPFDAEDDTSFAQLCARHDHPFVRQDEEPFTFAENIGIY
ncbi:hypothetical protein CYMTET_54813 [Cymbomonas tetramitiformis]|uniref:Uncharacterized protein n=1 Tax=Cymbomonas tetramitiformis TaxID=36881 RepID=A0AAE0BFE5_9CHLO|nr:hypothetical protein CYMTET_54813 [Cymbomonas tetramitiformis]